MDPVRNPFAPGAGTQPPELAGRADILERAETVIARALAGKHAKSFLLIGLRGVGKTVLLNRIAGLAEGRGVQPLLVEAHEDKPLPVLLLPALRQILLALDGRGNLQEKVKRGLRVLKSFANTIRVKYADLESDLPDLLTAVGEAAKARQSVVVLLVDELQYLDEAELSALIMGMHRAAQKQLPLVLIGAGLPPLVGNMGRSKSYAERLFDFPVVGALSKKDAYTAIVEPIGHEGEKIVKSAAEAIVAESQGYPYFLQVWGYQTWNEAQKSPIEAADVRSARGHALRNLDESFFRVRFDRLTPSEKRYLFAMAELGPGPHRSGDIAEKLDVKVQSVAPVRSSLIRKGMVFSPSHGDTAFTVPLFDEFLLRQKRKTAA